jgi:hypothetical protein
MKMNAVSVAGLALTVAIVLSVFAFPVNAGDPARFTIRAHPENIDTKQETDLTARVGHGTADCSYSVRIVVKNPDGQFAHKTVTLRTGEGGNGQVTVDFPGSFSGPGANTNENGNYRVSATFRCGYYASGAATTEFDVR